MGRDGRVWRPALPTKDGVAYSSADNPFPSGQGSAYAGAALSATCAVPSGATLERHVPLVSTPLRSGRRSVIGDVPDNRARAATRRAAPPAPAPPRLPTPTAERQRGSGRPRRRRRRPLPVLPRVAARADRDAAATRTPARPRAARPGGPPRGWQHRAAARSRPRQAAPAAVWFAEAAGLVVSLIA